MLKTQAKNSIRIALILLSITSVIAQDIPKLPNIGYLGSGYDLIKGNPQPTSAQADPGFTVAPIFTLAYTQNRTTPDGHYLIPDSVDAVRETSCSYATEELEVYGETSYSDQLKSSVDVNGKFPFGSFTASSDWSSSTEKVTTKHLISISARAQCSVYSAVLKDFVSIPVSDEFQGAVNYLMTLDPSNEKDGYLRVLGHFGTHYTSRILMGASSVLRSTFSRYTYYRLHSSNFSFSAGASASFSLFSGGASTMTSQQKQDAETYNQNRTEETQSFLGAHPSTDGDWKTWASTVEQSPYPFKYTLAPISSIMTTEYFPTLDATKLKAVSQKLDQYVDDYCQTVSGASCSAPKPDVPPLSYQTMVARGIGSTQVKCPAGTLATGVGFNRTGEFEAWPRYIINDDASGATCYDHDQVTCYAVCTNAFSAVNIVTAPGSRSTATCPTGTLVTSCGLSVGNGSDVEYYPNAYPTSSTSCECLGASGATCSAACVSQQELTNYQIVKSTDDLIKCPEDTQVIGCGYGPNDGDDHYEPLWSVHPDSNGCRCFNRIWYTDCYAICATLVPSDATLLVTNI
mmetsp:Transcript_11584/g.13345  ORF Transcript_11584/g.13345 Transcript_11584/m.13345 type:complete len:572 (+) Transcript_11584:46-1761(+)